MTITANIIAKAREVAYDTTKTESPSDVNRVLTTLTNNSFSTATKKEIIASIGHIHETGRVELTPEEIAIVERYMQAVAASKTQEQLDTKILEFVGTREVPPQEDNKDSQAGENDLFAPLRIPAEKYKDYISATLYTLAAQGGQEELMNTLHQELRHIISVLKSLKRIEQGITNFAEGIGEAFGAGINMLFGHFR